MFQTRPTGIMAATLLATTLALAGCGSSDPDYYTLRTWPGAAQGGGPLSLKIRTPSVAGYLDRDYIVAGDQDYRLKLQKNGAWGEPLDNMIGQTLAGDLQQRLPGTDVFTQAGAISTEAQATVELDVQRFSRTAAGLVELSASLSVHRASGATGSAPPARSIPLHLSMASQGSGVSAEVAALSQLLGQVADEAARQARLIGPMPSAQPIAMSGAMSDAGAGAMSGTPGDPSTVPVALAPR